MKSAEIRDAFLTYFEEQNHEIQSSAPLLTSDPDLLFNIAGMVPFKPYFLGEQNPPATRITTSQKCLRTEDIDRVGDTARHLTFFEMLGNFSFGDYFKEEAIKFGWEFLLERIGLNPDRLWLTVFGGDEEEKLDPDKEAEALWRSIDGVNDNRILHLNKEENFWKMGPTGPCGPCSEILYDQQSTDANPDDVKRMILNGEDRILELWNLVFMEMQRPREDAALEPLPEKNIDTGLGLERLAAILQDADSNFGTDLFRPLMEDIIRLTGADIDHNNNRSKIRVIADHIRAASFLITEGLLPGNEERSYVLRQLIRRAHLRGRHLGLREPFLSELVPTLIEIMGDHFDELKNNTEEIKKQLRLEEEQFETILEDGLSELDERIQSLREHDKSRMSGKKIFELYETHGLPVEMTTDVLDEEAIDYDEDEIREARDRHEARSRDESEEDELIDFNYEGIPTRTRFTGYEELEHESEILALFTGRDKERVESLDENDIEEQAYVILDRTPLYAEGGGQSGDRGQIIPDHWKVYNTIEDSGYYIHVVEPIHASPEPLRVGKEVRVRVDEKFRQGNMRHHTATHLLHHALRRELGDQVMQDGSSLDDESLRFDFTYNEAVNRKTLDRIEQTINKWIYEAIPIETEIMDREEAEEEGALAFFGEHYGQEVRVVKMVDDAAENKLDSKEFCGGTHLDNTLQVGVFVITNETAVASGVRRIEAKAGQAAYNYLRKRRKDLREAAGAANVQQLNRLDKRIEELKDTIDQQKDELDKLRQQQSSSHADKLARNPETIGGCQVVVDVLEEADQDSLKTMADEVRKEMNTGVVFLVSRSSDNVQLILATTDTGTDEIDAGAWVGELGRIVGGGGGGRPDFAEAGGSDPDAVDDAIDRFKELVRESFAETAGG